MEGSKEQIDECWGNACQGWQLNILNSRVEDYILGLPENLVEHESLRFAQTEQFES